MIVVKQSKLNKYFLLYSISIIMVLFLNDPLVSAEPDEDYKVLVVYSSKTGELDEQQRALDMLIGHFTQDITFKDSQEVTKQDLKDITHLFYYGQIAEKLPKFFHSLFNDYTGYFIAIGYNSEHLGGHFSFIDPLHEKVINQLQFVKNRHKKWDIFPELIVETRALANNNEVIVEGQNPGDKTVYPIVIKNGLHYYVAIDNFHSDKKIMMGELLHDIFKSEHEEYQQAFIRLEDIHPLVDPQNVKEIVDILKEKNIPFMMAVIPVYTNPETGKQFHFSDSPKLLKVLKEAQQNGGSIVLHGYTHQFRKSETGEGFEFWDVENNTPVYSKANAEFTLRTENEFSNQDAYKAYMNELIDYETSYIKAKITRGIQELTNYGLYPLAFEAPHYTMSQNGYQVISEFFSTYVGQIQLSDRDWEIMDTTPYVTSPSFLGGLELIPETMGYVIPDNEQAIEEMMARAESYQKTNDGMLGAFYHPYLGAERFTKLIEQMEVLPNLSWINLQDWDVWVKAENVHISTKNGEIVPQIKQSKLLLSSIDFPFYHLNRFVHFIFWVIAGIGGIAIIIFIGFTLFFSLKRTKIGG